MMKYPTDKEIEKAKAYIRLRLAAEVSMRNNLDKVMEKAAERIVAISYRYNIPASFFRFSANRKLKEEVEAVIAWLRETIEDYALTLAVADHEDKEQEIIAYVSRKSYGKTLLTRIGEYTSRFRDELEAAVAAGLYLETGKEKLLKSIFDSRKAPFSNPLMADAVNEGSDLYARLNVRTSYGQGRTNSAHTGLRDLTKQAVAEGWMQYALYGAKEAGAIGYYVFRGSSYPCSRCDDMVGFQPDEQMLPPYHPNCCCYFVPIFETLESFV